jgi:hypothetical protein
MLFDLRGRGRRRTIKVVYITLAFLMGGGLVLFGIGGEVSGGLFDVFTDPSTSSDDGAERFEKREAEALKRTQANPQDAAAWADLARARYQQAGLGDNYNPETGAFTAAGERKVAAATDAWEKYLGLDPPKPDERLARQMLLAYQATGDAAKAARAQAIVADANPKNANLQAQLAALYYAAGNTRLGDLARKKALDLTEPDMREALKGQLDAAKSEALQQQLQDVQESAGAGATASPAP